MRLVAFRKRLYMPYERGVYGGEVCLERQNVQNGIEAG